jgi:hypothetical protein
MNLIRSGAHGRSAQIVRIKRIHYVAPSVGAYNPGRVRKTALLLDAMLALQPFERAVAPPLIRLCYGCLASSHQGPTRETCARCCDLDRTESVQRSLYLRRGAHERTCQGIQSGGPQQVRRRRGSDGCRLRQLSRGFSSQIAYRSDRGLGFKRRKLLVTPQLAGGISGRRRRSRLVIFFGSSV